MPLSYRRFIALGLARALLAGPPRADGLQARAEAAMGERHPALAELANTLASGTGSWHRETHTSLADRLLAEPAFGRLFDSRVAPPRLRRLILRPPAQHPPPLGLDALDPPGWPTTGELAAWLGLDTPTLAWLADSGPRRRASSLGNQHYRGLLLPKPRGGLRLLEAPLPRLKAVQRRLLDELLARMPAHEAACGFVRGGSVREHAARHAGQEAVLRYDLQDYFGSIPASRVHALFETLGYPVAVARTLAALTTCRTPEPVLQRLLDEGALDRPRAARLREAHLPQGAPTSPALANLCSFRLDLRLQALAESAGARYSRYADDLAFSGPAALAARSADFGAQVAAIALAEGFRLNHRKTRVATQARAQRLCGVVVNRHPNLPRAEFDRLRAELHQRALAGPQPAEDAATLRGRIAWAESLNRPKAARLHRLWARITWMQAAAPSADN